MLTKNPWQRARMALRSPRAVIVVVRHGSTDRNRGGVGLDAVRGHADIPMTDEGRQEVLITARIISDDDFVEIYTSDLQRAVETSEIVAQENIGQGVIDPDPALRSWDMGPSMEGQVTTPDVVAQIREWVREDTVVPPGGESFRAFVSRLLAYVQPLFEEALAEGKTCAIVTHGRCVQVIDFWVAAGCDEACMRRDYAELLAEEPDTIPPGGAVRYRHDGFGWVGTIVPTGMPSAGTEVAGGDHMGKRGVVVS